MPFTPARASDARDGRLDCERVCGRQTRQVRDEERTERPRRLKSAKEERHRTNRGTGSTAGKYCQRPLKSSEPSQASNVAHMLTVRWVSQTISV
jgi:hypothetical protein